MPREAFGPHLGRGAGSVPALQQILKRGRRSSTKSPERYEKHDRLALRMSERSEGRPCCPRDCEAHVAACVLGAKAVIRPPPMCGRSSSCSCYQEAEVWQGPSVLRASKRMSGRSGEPFDSTKPKNVSSIRQMLRKCEVMGACLAPPCASFSIARDRALMIRGGWDP
ncbi:unnamed protein product [Prorocentrum cordatum]|uniref:Uncharacterized protein n=1 Tax=Prorocentrum cordatum TaxID=2364126 RepID=A0ABN9PQ07_9DINO|nr:unnamed protein product [Polarella glacialis]